MKLYTSRAHIFLLLKIHYTVNLDFLPTELRRALKFLNINNLSEIRLRKGQPVIIEYLGEYHYINNYGISRSVTGAIKSEEVESVLGSAMHGSVYAYTEQLKRGFITVDGGIRIGVGGEYVTERDKIVAVRGATSLNIRIPHCIDGCGSYILKFIENGRINSTLIFSSPGFGKTTILRDLAKSLSNRCNVLVFDERCEISALDGAGNGFNLGERCDVVRGGDKIAAFPNAIRAMKPDVIITDELYGNDDYSAVKYAIDCGITVFASTHICDREKLINTPFEYFVELTGIGKEQIVYDKDFNIVGNYRPDNDDRISSVHG
ncbi:MAG: hypothetical protein ACI4L9_04070 [Candidatus Coproplasma sp.]